MMVLQHRRKKSSTSSSPQRDTASAKEEAMAEALARSLGSMDPFDGSGGNVERDGALSASGGTPLLR